jgi:stage II sporulation protein D
MLKQLFQLGNLGLLFWVATINPAAALELRVAIKDGVRQVNVASSTEALVRDGNGTVLGEVPEMDALAVQVKGGKIALDRWRSGQLWIEPTKGGYVWIGDRWYRGRTQLVPNQKGIIAVNYVDLEQYLYSVLGGEMNGDWPQEALKAQAVAARSYALYKRETAGNRVYDLGSSTTWQVYRGLETESEGTQLAVDATANQVLTYNGKIILAVFHSSSGGHTENVEDIWTDALPYLRGVPDYDRGTPEYQWTKSFSGSELSRLLGVGNITSLELERTTTYGRVITVQVASDRGIHRLSGSKIAQALGLKSTRFTVNPTSTGFQITGYGFGHGVGLSQWGAYNLAQMGINYQQILSHYYQGTQLVKFTE